MKSFETTDLNRRLANMIHIGVVESADHARGTVRVRVGEIETADLHMVVQRAGADRSWWPYEPGEQVCVAAPSGNLAAGVILGAIYSSAAPAPGDKAGLSRVVFADGSVIEYDRNTHHFAMRLAGGTVEIIAAKGLTITGDVTVNGDVVADGISLKTHVHGGVTPGPANTAGPV